MSCVSLKKMAQLFGSPGPQSLVPMWRAANLQRVRRPADGAGLCFRSRLMGPPKRRGLPRRCGANAVQKQNQQGDRGATGE